ncbi:MAG: type IV toxin-antitoxin system AbiEi family antitoxin domain-containing protein [Solirubrobacterales bacterium]|nr:type IV toxin-antitoxin system AbiEi family antitoxin domain-containing protein [Solirubrobacterales bacterium]
MGSTKHHSLSGNAWELARRQHGVVARRQLLALGLTPQMVQHRLSKGRLHRIDRGIYTVGRPELTRRGRWTAAVLSCGGRAALSHASAAALWGFGAESTAWIEVSVPFPSPRRRAGIWVHRRPGLRAEDVVVEAGIPVTTPVRTLVDQAWRLGDIRLERSVNEADRLELIDPEALLAALARFPGQRGVRQLRGLLADRTFRFTDSELERRFLPIAAGAGLGAPQTQQELNGYRTDFYWPDLGLVVETDGLRYHRTPAQQARDRLRDQAHTAAGLANLRFTHQQIRYEPTSVAGTLRATVEQIRRGEERHRGGRGGP